ncbi:MAG: hypothetical protein S4CHLAM20_13220 [Chlamydiia bacterium]|nr:hypothetical protein [Chlamydiia bacterium]
MSWLYKRSFFFSAILLFNSIVFAKDSKELSGNIKTDHAPTEFGKVPCEEALNIPRAQTISDHHYDYLISAAYTLWVAYQEGLNVAVSNMPSTSIANLTAGNIIRPNNPAQSGFKVSAYMLLQYDDWAVGLDYTWFNNQNGLRSNGFFIDNIYTSPWLNFDTLDISEISSSFSNQFNRLDLRMQRSLALSPYFTMTPHSFIVGAWEDQHFNANMEPQKTINDIDLFFMRNTQYWYCIGPGAGTEIALSIVNHLSFYLSSAMAITFAKHDVRQKQQEAETETPNDKTFLVNRQDDRWDVEEMLEASLGLRIDYEIYNVVALLEASWDSQTWFSHNGFLSAANTIGNTGNYSMQGLTITAGVYF